MRHAHLGHTYCFVTQAEQIDPGQGDEGGEASERDSALMPQDDFDPARHLAAYGNTRLDAGKRLPAAASSDGSPARN